MSMFNCTKCGHNRVSHVLAPFPAGCAVPDCGCTGYHSDTITYAPPETPPDVSPTPRYGPRGVPCRNCTHDGGRHLLNYKATDETHCNVTGCMCVEYVENYGDYGDETMEPINKPTGPAAKPTLELPDDEPTFG